MRREQQQVPFITSQNINSRKPGFVYYEGHRFLCRMIIATIVLAYLSIAKAEGTAFNCSSCDTCEDHESIAIPYGTTSISRDAFKNCATIKHVVIPDSVRTIGSSAFESCSSLSSVVIPPSVAIINSHTFRYCTSLTIVTILPSVKEIGTGAFKGCTSLICLIWGGEEGVNIMSDAFKDCPLTGCLVPYAAPTRQPTPRPSTSKPSSQPSSSPSVSPSGQPSAQPTSPTGQPTSQPTSPTGQPTGSPTGQPTRRPTSQPSRQPSGQPSRQPLSSPSSLPSSQPSSEPSCQPSAQPTVQPSAPTSLPSGRPTGQPSRRPTSQPSGQPTRQPTGQPSRQPTGQPSGQPSRQPTGQPSRRPTQQPSSAPSGQPSAQPTTPTGQPSSQPTSPTSQPSAQPSGCPSGRPTSQPSRQPTRQPTGQPSRQPSGQPTAQPSRQPTGQPSRQPTGQPSGQPSRQPTGQPSRQPTSQPTSQPSRHPSGQPSHQPSVQPTSSPSKCPSSLPSGAPTTEPTTTPQAQPSEVPSSQPSSLPTLGPTTTPSSCPSMQPYANPTGQPTGTPTESPTMHRTGIPSSVPSGAPTDQPTVQPSGTPTKAPRGTPTAMPSVQPTGEPTCDPSSNPSATPTVQPSSVPTATPTEQPSSRPTGRPTTEPSVQPSVQPSSRPTGFPTAAPSSQPSNKPSVSPTSSEPTARPTLQPSATPSVRPTSSPSFGPVAQPTANPTSQPTSQPSSEPSGQPTLAPTSMPSSQPTSQPTAEPSAVPSMQAPSLTHTAAPTKLTAGQWSDKLTGMQASLHSGLSNRTVHTAVYSELIVEASKVHGGCAPWSSVLSANIQPSSVQFRATEVRMMVVEVLGAKPITLSCMQSSEVTQIVRYLSSTAHTVETAVPLDVTCGDHRWVGRHCVNGGSQPSICVDCEDPCSVETHCASEVGGSAPQYPHVISPCSQRVCGASNSSVSTARLLAVAFEDHAQAPVISNLNISATRSSITVEAKLNGVGAIACAVYRKYDSSRSSLNTVPSSHAQILLQNYVAPTREGGVSSVVIGGLSALTDYKLYCMTVSASNTMTPMSTVLADARSATTACCKLATVSTTANSVAGNKNVLNFLSVVLSSPPSRPLHVRLTVYDSATGGEVRSVLVPSTFTVPVSTSNQAVVLVSSLSGMASGDYYIMANVSGPADKEYEVTYGTAAAASKVHFTVLSDTQSPPVPVLRSAVYASDGSHVKVSFDSATNRGGTATKFTCSQLFNFTCATTSSCQWLDSATVHVFVTRESHCAAPGDQLSLQPSASIKAACASRGGDCESRSSAVAAVVSILAPESSVSPAISINAPSTIGRCSSLTVDISGSTGSGGRPWDSSQITVTASSPTANVTAIQRFLGSEYKLSPPTPIPWQLLTSHVTYTFTAKLCNFMGKCSQRQSRVTVVDSALPTVTVSGATSREVKRNSALSVTAEAYVADCDMNRTTSGLAYLWSVSTTNGVSLPHLVSESREPSKLLLPAYSLAAGAQYSVTLTVTIASTQKSTVSVVQVMVVQGDVVAVIAGGTSQAVTAGGLLTLGASDSYDEDIQGVAGSAAGLAFEWTCKQTEPVLSVNCSNVFLNIEELSTNTSQFIALVSSAAIDAAVEITATVSDATGGRSATSTVRLTVLPDMSPVVALSSNAVNSVVNSDREVKLFGSITLPTASGVVEGGNATWSVDDTSIVSLADVALAPLFVPIPPNTAVKFDVYLVLGANKLPTGTSLTFSLMCKTSGGHSSATAVTVMINAPPQPGTFAVAAIPRSQLSTFAAVNWVDSDLPLDYQFGFLSNGGGTKVTLTARSATTSTSARVPGGLVANGYMVDCFVDIFDSHNANATALAAVQLYPSAGGVDVQSQIASLFTSNRATVNEKKQIAAVASGLLNTVDCSLAPDCASLNRAACYKTRNTCGECKPSYLGDAGDSNSPCVLTSADSNPLDSQLQLNSSCLSVAQCGLFQHCVNGRCAQLDKQCPSRCSGRGQCVSQSINSGKRLLKCQVGDTSCDAVCVCEADYQGSADCSITTADLTARQASRELVISSIGDLMELEDPDAQSVEAWINSLSEATQAPNELSANAVVDVLKMSLALIDYASQVGLSAGYAERLLNSIDSAAQASIASFTHRRRLSGVGNATDYFSSSLAQSENALQKYADLVSSNMLPGQYPVELVYSQFRSNIQVYSAAGGASKNLSVSVPMSALEQMNGRQSSSFSLPLHSSNESDAPLRVSVVSMLSSLYQAVEGSLESNPLTISMSAMPTCAVPPCHIEIVLQYSESLNHTYLRPNEPEFVETVCLRDVIVSSNHTCRDGSIMSLHCNGSAHILSAQCPYTEFSPVCSSLLGSEIVTTDVCTAVAVTDTNITCSCPIGSADSVHRMLSNSNSTGYSASYVSMLSTIRTSFLTTVRSADDLDADTVRSGWRVVVTIGVFAAAVIVALIGSNQADERQKINKTKEGGDVVIGKTSIVGSLKANIKIAAEKVVKHKKTSAKVAKARQGGVINKDLALIESSLPSVLSSQTMSTRIVNEVKHNHRWLGVVFFYSVSFPRVLRVVSLATNIIIMLFIQSLTYTLTNPDDGSCELLTTRVGCEEPLSPFATGESKCAWDGTQCIFIQPGNSARIILFVAVFCAIISTPFALGTDWFIRHILAAGTLKQNKVVTSSADPALIATGSGRRNRRTAVNASQASEFMAQAELLSLSSALMHYREGLATSQKIEFDLVWGLNGDGQFKSPDDNHNNNNTLSNTDLSVLQQLTRLCQVAAKKTTDVKQTVLDDLTRIIDSVAEESKTIESESMNNRLIGRKLLFLFQCDLLPGISGKILHNKGQRDAMTAKRVPLGYKIAAWALLLLQNTGMLFYILLFALNENEQRQGAWLQSFILWLVVEILLVSTAVAIFTHVVIPLLTMRDVTKIKQRLMENVQAFHQSVANKRRRDASEKYREHPENEHKSDELKVFNAAEYLFVSTRLAKKYPDIKEAQIIAQFNTPWPRQSYQHVTDVSKGYSKKFSSITRGLSMVLVFVLTSLLAIPPSLQDMVIGMVSTATIGYTTLLHIQLFGIFPLLAFCPFIVLCVIAHFVIQSQKSAAKTRLAKLFPATNVEFPVEKDEFMGPKSEQGKSAHKTRRQSVALGIDIMQQIERSGSDIAVAESSGKDDHCGNGKAELLSGTVDGVRCQEEGSSLHFSGVKQHNDDDDEGNNSDNNDQDDQDDWSSVLSSFDVSVAGSHVNILVPKRAVNVGGGLVQQQHHQQLHSPVAAEETVHSTSGFNDNEIEDDTRHRNDSCDDCASIGSSDCYNISSNSSDDGDGVGDI